MDLKEHTTPANLLKYAFMWNQVRLLVAALSLIFGGFPIVFRLFSSSSSAIGSLLSVAWIISGLAALYLVYMWYQGGRTLFGGKDNVDMAAFAIAMISGLHLGIAGIFGINIGMKVIPYGMLTMVMIVAGLLYLWSAFHLHKRFSANRKIFG